MHVLIIGAAGMIGRKLAQRLIRDGGLGGGEISALTLVDVTTPENPEEFAAESPWRVWTSPIHARSRV
jgi:nucleoside-diphosphate-sugar epimerase